MSLGASLRAGGARRYRHPRDHELFVLVHHGRPLGPYRGLPVATAVFDAVLAADNREHPDWYAPHGGGRLELVRQEDWLRRRSRQLAITVTVPVVAAPRCPGRLARLLTTVRRWAR